MAVVWIFFFGEFLYIFETSFFFLFLLLSLSKLSSSCFPFSQSSFEAKPESFCYSTFLFSLEKETFWELMRQSLLKLGKRDIDVRFSGIDFQCIPPFLCRRRGDLTPFVFFPLSLFSSPKKMYTQCCQLLSSLTLRLNLSKKEMRVKWYEGREEF